MNLLYIKPSVSATKSQEVFFMLLSRLEQETVINFNEVENTARVYTHNKSLIRKLDRLAHERPGECHRRKEGKIADCIIPKGWVKISPPRRLSESQKEQLRKASWGTRFPKEAEHGK